MGSVSVGSRVLPGEKDGVAGFVPAAARCDVVGTIELVAGVATVTRADGIRTVLKIGNPVFESDIIETAANGRVAIRFIDGTALNLSANARVVLREFTSDEALPSALFGVERGNFAFSAGHVAKAGRLRIETPVATIRGRMRSGGIGILSLSALFFAALEKAEAVSGPLGTDDGTIDCKDLGEYGVVELVPHGRPQPQFLSACEVIHILANGSSDVSPLSPTQLAQLQVQQQETLQIFRLGLQVPTLTGPGGSSTNPNFELPPALVKPINFIMPENNTAPQNSLNSGSGPNKTTISDTFIQIPPPPPPPPGPVTPAPVPEVPDQTNNPDLHDTNGTLAGPSVSISDPSFVWSNGSLSDPQLQSLRDASTLSLPLGSADFTFSIPDNALDFLAAGETLTVIYSVTITDGNGNNLTQQIVIKAAGSEDIPQITTAATDNSLAELVGTNNESTHAVSGAISFVDVDLTDRPTVTAPFASYSYLAADGTTTLTLTAAQQSAVETALTITPDAGNANNGSAGWTYSVPDNALDFLAQGETLTLTYTGTVNDGHGGVVTTPITVTIHGTNDEPVIAAGTTATGEIQASGQGDSGSGGPVVAAALVNGSGGNALVNGLGGSAGFGENTLAPNDDGSTGPLDITAVFGPTGLDFFGHNYTIIYVNNNGNVTFGNSLSNFTPDPIGTNLGFPIIAPFWGDVDTRGGAATVTPGGNSTGSDLVYYDFDTVNGVFTVTWDDVGYYSYGTDKLNAFQLQLINQGNGDFDIVFRYENINWTAGSASGGSGGLGGTAARAGYSAGDNNPNHSFELPESGIQADMLALPGTPSNTADPGVFEFHVRNGVVVSEQLTATGVIDFTDPDYTDTHTATFVAEGANYVGTFMLDPITQDSSNGATGQVGWSFSADDSELAYLAAGESVVQRYDVTIDDGHGGTTTQTVAITITGANNAPVITSETQSGTVTEIADNAPGENTAVHSQSGTITYSDADNLDTHTAIFAPAASNTTALGTFALDLSNIDSGNGGAIGWTFTVSDAALDYLQADQVVTQAYDVTVNDGHGGTATQTVTVTITGTNDAPVANADTNWAQEDGPNATGDVLQTNAHPGAPSGTFSDIADTDVDSPTLTVSRIQNASESHAVASGSTSTSGGTVIHGLYGTLTIGADGTYSYHPNDNINNAAAVQDVFTYTVTDGLATATTTLTISVGDGPGPTHGSAITLNVDEAALSTSGATGTNPSSTAEADSAQLSFTAGSDNLTSFAFSNSLAGLVTDLNGDSTPDIFWDHVSGTQIKGYLDAGHTQLAVTLDLSAPASIAADTTGSAAVTMTLSDNLQHPNGSGAQISSLGNIGVVATDIDGDATTGTVNLNVKDDVPTAGPGGGSTQAVLPDTNLLITLDLSGSMDQSAGTGGFTKLELAKQAVLELIDQYDALGHVKIELVTFATTATDASGGWVDMNNAAAKAALINTILGLSAGGSTNYDAALAEDMTAFNAGGKLTTPGVQNVAYFLSDGAPTVGDGNTSVLSNAAAGGSGDAGIQSNEESTWRSFVNTNDIDSFALGIGSAATQSALNPVAYDGRGAGTNTNGIVVTDLSQLIGTLVATVSASPVSGNLITGGLVANLGADGGYFRSLVVDGTTYTFDGVNSISVSGGLDHHTGFNTTTDVLTVATSAGGTIAMDLGGANVGQYTYTPSATVTTVVETFGYSVIDGDGDTASNTLTVTISPATTPTVVRDDYVVTNQSTVSIPDWALLVNDTNSNGTTQAITNVGSAAAGDSVSHASGSVTYTDNNPAGGSFIYTDTAGAFSDSAHVAITHDGFGAIDGSYLSEILIGGSGNDIINGNQGDDALIGNGGNDTLNGGDGNDALSGGAGNDTLNGGNGSDTAVYIDAPSSVTVNLATGTASGGDGTDTLNSIENIVGSAFNDTLTGNGGSNFLMGGGGGDQLTGGGGGDTFVFAAITDSQPGAGHFDTITDFVSGSDHVDFSLISGLNDNGQAVNILSFASAPATIAAHTIEIVTSGGNTVIYANASATAEALSVADMEIHVANIVHSTDFILHH